MDIYEGTAYQALAAAADHVANASFYATTDLAARDDAKAVEEINEAIDALQAARARIRGLKL